MEGTECSLPMLIAGLQKGPPELSSVEASLLLPHFLSALSGVAWTRLHSSAFLVAMFPAGVCQVRGGCGRRTASMRQEGAHGILSPSLWQPCMPSMPLHLLHRLYGSSSARVAACPAYSCLGGLWFPTSLSSRLTQGPLFGFSTLPSLAKWIPAFPLLSILGWLLGPE